MAFNFGQILGAAAAGGIPAYNQSTSMNQLRQLQDLDMAGQQALGRAMFSGPIPGVGPIGGPQAPPPGQQSMPAPRPYPPVQGPPQQQVVGDMFGGRDRPIEMGPPPTAMVPPVQPPPQQASPQGPPGGGAPPSAGGAPPAGVGMHDPILARIAAANPGAPPQVLMSAYQQYVMMNRPRYGLSPESLALRQQREQRLMSHENRLGMQAEDQQATRAAMQPQRAINPQTGHVIIMQGDQWVDEQSGQPLVAPAKKPGKQSAADNTEFSSQSRRPEAAPAEKRGYRGPEIPMEEFDQRPMPADPPEEIARRALPPQGIPQWDWHGREQRLPPGSPSERTRSLLQDKRTALDNTEFSSQARVYKGDSSQNYNPMAPKNKLDPEYQPEVRKYKGEEQSDAKFQKEQFARAQKEARPHMDYFLKGVDKEAATNIKRAFKDADLDSLERLHELTPRQRYNMHNFLADRGEFPTTDTDYEAVYGRDTTMGERPSPMTSKRWGRVQGSPSQRRPLDYLE